MLQTFCILYIGSKGETENELRNFFSLPNKTLTFSTLVKINQEMTNSISFSKLNLICVPNYLSVNDAYVKYINKLGTFTQYDPKNPQNAQKLNNIISQSTNGLIKNIIKSEMLQNSIVIINTLYFKSKWKHPFSSSDTKPELFNGIQQIKVLMMKQEGKHHKYFEDSFNQILEMDYKNSNFAMGFILPKSQYTEPMINPDQFGYYISALKAHEINVLKIPKFRHESKYEISGLIKKMGVTILFDNPDLSDIIPKTNNIKPTINKIVHAAVIIVDESGTEAAASTMTELDGYSPNMKKINFIANHKFMYYIRHIPSNIVIFIGQHY
jgi:serine protease inhibitor